jgi:FkbM family methyltransferase
MSLKELLDSSAMTKPLMRAARGAYRPLRSAYLRRRYPHGGWVYGSGVPIFCDFRDPSYAWYDGAAPNLVFDDLVLASLMKQSHGSVFLDVGAHYGFYSAKLGRLVSNRSPRAKLIAFEPQPENFRCLEKTCERIDAVEVLPLRMALGDIDGEVPLYRSNDADCARIFAGPTSYQTGTTPVRRLDSVSGELLAEGDRIAVIKVDIDGAEPAFLRGAAATIERDQPLIFIEFAPLALPDAGVDPKQYFQGLFRRFHVYWVRWDTRTVRAVGPESYEEINAHVGDTVTDLVLSSRPLSFPEFS